MKRAWDSMSSVQKVAGGAVNCALRLPFAGLLLFPVLVSAQAQPQTRDRSVPPVQRVTPAPPRVAGILPEAITVGVEEVAALASRLEEFGNGLSGAERGLLDQLLLRAAAAPSDAPQGTDVKVRLFTGGMRREGEAEPAGIIVQGGRGQSGGGIATSPIDALREMLGPGVVSIGPKQDDPRSPTSSLAEKMRSFGEGLSVPQKAMLDWLLQRASASRHAVQGSPNGPRPSPERALRAALGMEAIGPKQDDPSPRPDSQRWTLRF